MKDVALKRVVCLDSCEGRNPVRKEAACGDLSQAQ